MIKTKYLKKLLPIITSATIGLGGCALNEVVEDSQMFLTDSLIETDNIEDDQFKLDYEKDVIVSTIKDVNVRLEPNDNGEIIGLIPMDALIEINQKLDNNWYEIKYRNITGYVPGEYVSEEVKYIVKNKSLKVAYLKNDTTVYDDNNLELGIVPTYESVVVYNEDDTRYYGVIGDYIGYIDKVNTEELTGTYVVVDISSQMLKLYIDGECTFVTPVITGRGEESITPIGIYEIYDTRGHRDLVGPNYRSYVDYMMKFNGDIGLHDAEYHTDYDEYGNVLKKHGWKNKSDFGGHTYIKNGSHGCVNMMHDAAEYVNENVDIGTKVLVKR